MRKSFYRGLMLTALSCTLLVVLMACDQRPSPELRSNNQPTTAAAQTRAAQTNAPPTSGPSPTPTLTSTPYMTATPFPGADPDAIVTTIGDRTVSLAEFQARVRYERWLPIYALERNVDIYGAEAVLDLSRPENAQTVALFHTINSAPTTFGLQVLNSMQIEQVVLNEAAARDLDMVQTVYDGRIAARIGVELGRNGVRPANWDDAYDGFIADMELYTGMSEAQFLETMRALAFYDQIREIIGEQADLDFANNEPVTAIIVQDIILNTAEDGVTARELLADGATMSSVAERFGLTLAGTETERRVRRNAEGIPANIIEDMYDADVGDVVGPYPTDAGWYVAIILDEELDVFQPEDLDAMREDHYVNWINAQLEDPSFVTTDDMWRDFVPTDPLPRDVSPYMRDENFTLPEDPYTIDGATATPLPISDILPR